MFRKKILQTVFAVVLCLAAVFACVGAAACAQEKVYTVSFEMLGHGSAPASQTVTDGGHAAEPETQPIAEGWTFGGWYKEEGCTNKFVFESETITSDTKVYAKWTENTPDPVTYTVTFDMQGHGTAPAAQTVTSGEHATAPATAPTAEGWTFGGWYKEEGCTNVFDFETETITAATTVYAKWTEVIPEPVTYTVTFDMQGHGTAPAAQTVTSGEHATAPATAPTAEGWTFGGWYKEEGCTNVFDFETETITSATTVYAKWTENTPDPGPAQSTPLTGKIYVVGDSTVCSFSDTYYMPRYGYGTQLYNYFNCTETQIVNLALSGRSSLSFLTESNYTTLKNSISAGDYLIIGFGHNDEKSDEVARYTDANGTYNAATTANGPSFQYTLYENYVKLAKDKGATPILCTPIVRYDSTFAYSGSKIHDTTTSDKSGKGGDYAAAIKALGQATGTTVIDLTAITKADYTELKGEAIYYHAHTTYDGDKPNETPAGRDDTHINKYGAKTVAYYIASELLKTNCTLKNHVKNDIARPTRENDFEGTVSSTFVKSDYTQFNPATTTARNIGTVNGQNWYFTAMGALGGNSTTVFTGTKTGENITVAQTTNKGKFDSKSDGFGAAFIQVDVSKNFTISATATVKERGDGAVKQAAFGIMLRDDIYIDTRNDTLSSNYVTAGALTSETGDSAIFSRENGTLTKGSSTTIAKDATYNLSIERVGQTVTVNFSDGTHNYTKKYTDFDFVAVDNDYMYVCLIANRGLTVEYSNINFEITGEAQGA